MIHIVGCWDHIWWSWSIQIPQLTFNLLWWRQWCPLYYSSLHVISMFFVLNNDARAGDVWSCKGLVDSCLVLGAIGNFRSHDSISHDPLVRILRVEVSHVFVKHIRDLCSTSCQDLASFKDWQFLMYWWWIQHVQSPWCKGRIFVFTNIHCILLFSKLNIQTIFCILSFKKHNLWPSKPTKTMLSKGASSIQ